MSQWRDAVREELASYREDTGESIITLQELEDRSLDRIADRFPKNQNPDARLRQTLQQLKNNGEVEFVDYQGTYRILELTEHSTARPFEVGKEYVRSEIHDEYGGMRFSGISPCSDYPIVLLFTGEGGEQYGYEDEFLEDGTFVYTGEGQEGDMTWDHGNRAIRDHQKEDNQLHLFESNGDGTVTYVGEYEFESAFREELPDRNDDLRDAIRFRLVPAGGRDIEIEAEDPEELSSEELYQKAKASVSGSGTEVGSSGGGSGRTATRTTYSRSELVKQFARRVADGVCIGCDEPAPFEDENGEPFLEVHHLFRRSDGGADDPDNVVAICPNCHRRVHHGRNGEEFNQHLVEQVEDRTSRQIG